jgi:hypothetical protein
MKIWLDVEICGKLEISIKFNFIIFFITSIILVKVYLSINVTNIMELINKKVMWIS